MSGNNLWLNLTVFLPGMVTYGTWRLVILLIGYKGIDFSAIDSSIVLSRTIDKFFLSLNLAVGQVLVFLFIFQAIVLLL